MDQTRAATVPRRLPGPNAHLLSEERRASRPKAVKHVPSQPTWTLSLHANMAAAGASALKQLPSDRPRLPPLSGKFPQIDHAYRR